MSAPTLSVICLDAPSLDADHPRKLTGFALPGYASRAGRKGQDLGLSHRWTPAEARAMGASGGRSRMERMTAEQRQEVARRGGLARWKAVHE